MSRDSYFPKVQVSEDGVPTFIFHKRNLNALFSNIANQWVRENTYADDINSVSYLGILSQLMNAVLMDCPKYSVMSLEANTSFAT